MQYGPNTDVVQEVIEYVRTGPLFAPQEHSDFGSSCSLLRDFEEAKALAWNIPFRDIKWTWTDIRENEMAEVRGVRYQIDGFDEYRDSLRDLLQVFTRYVKRRLQHKYSAVLDDVVADLYNCAFTRAVYGVREDFFERLFVVYRAGGWPCGWDGEYPDGRLVVYIPTPA